MHRPLQRLVAVLALWTLLLGYASAQRTISGVIKNDSGEPLIGVNILVVGTTTGTISDFDGSYSLSVPAGSTQLQFSYTGFESVILALGASDRVDVVLTEGTLLSDVVITGYGTVKREDVTGAIATVREDAFNKGSIVSAQELLSGKVAGVTIATGGDPGAGSVIRIRGGSSLSATNDPLVIIDGVPISTDVIAGSRNFLNIINPNDIESFTVLKDASATAIYGSRASNGVIIITTKKGSLSRKFAVDYHGNVAMSTIAKRANSLDAAAFRTLVENKYAEGSSARKILGNANTDWQDVIMQSPLSHDHNLALSGAVGDFLPYRVSLGYTNKDGLLLTDNFNRLTYGVNLNPSFMDNRLQLNLSVKGMTDKNRFADAGAIGAAVIYDPTQEVYAENDFGGYYNWLNGEGLPNVQAVSNPLALIEMTDNRSTVNRYILGGQIDYRFHFLDDLRANLNLALDNTSGSGRKLIPHNAPFAYVTDGRSEEYGQDIKNSLLELFLNYNRSLNENFRLDLMGGYSWQRFQYDDFFGAYSNGLNDTPELRDTLTDYDDNPREYYLLSLFGRANLTFFDDFLLTLSLRRDGTSRFSKENRWGSFPGVAFAWKILNDRPGALNSLKFRVGYGLTGQQGTSDKDFYPYLPRYVEGNSTAQYHFGNDSYFTYRPNGYDYSLKWEETTTINAGFDFGFFKDRLTGSIDYYIRNTKDLINFVPVPAGSNLTNFILTNVGDLKNTGLELALNAVPWRKNAKEWTVGFNVALNKNEITRLTATNDENYLGVFLGSITGGVDNNLLIHSVGFPAYSFYVYEQVYNDQGLPIEGVFVDRNNDGVITPLDQYRYKQAAPKAVFGFYSSLDLGRFDLSTGIRANVGNYVYNNNLANQGVVGFVYNSLGGGDGYLLNVLEEGVELDIQTPRYLSDHYVQNGSFLRVDHITAGYNFGFKNSSIKRLRLYLTAQNPLLITRYKGIDPEIANGTSPGIDNNIYPRSRTFLLGLNVGF